MKEGIGELFNKLSK